MKAQLRSLYVCEQMNAFGRGQDMMLGAEARGEAP